MLFIYGLKFEPYSKHKVDICSIVLLCLFPKLIPVDGWILHHVKGKLYLCTEVAATTVDDVYFVRKVISKTSSMAP